MGFRDCPGNRKPLGSPADFPGEIKGGKGQALPFTKYIIGKQGNNPKWKMQPRIA